VNAIDPDKLDMCLQALADIESLPPEHPDAVAVRGATAGIFKSVKKARRHAKRDAVAAADHAVTSATATGAPGRIDDEMTHAITSSKTVRIDASSTQAGSKARTMVLGEPASSRIRMASMVATQVRRGPSVRRGLGGSR
jgi:hypothetical protein